MLTQSDINSYRVTTLRHGQERRYGDTVGEYSIFSHSPEDEVKRFCTETLRPCKTEKQEATSPFETYYEFWRTGENEYRYKVTEPYCD